MHFSALLVLCAGNSPVTGEFPSQRPVTRSFDASFISAWIKGWVNNPEAGDLRRHRGHYDVIVMTGQTETHWRSSHWYWALIRGEHMHNLLMSALIRRVQWLRNVKFNICYGKWLIPRSRSLDWKVSFVLRDPYTIIKYITASWQKVLVMSSRNIIIKNTSAGEKQDPTLISPNEYYREVTWASWHLDLPETREFVQQLARVKSKGNIKFPHHCSFVREIHRGLVDYLHKGSVLRKAF